MCFPVCPSFREFPWEIISQEVHFSLKLRNTRTFLVVTCLSMRWGETGVKSVCSSSSSTETWEMRAESSVDREGEREVSFILSSHLPPGSFAFWQRMQYSTRYPSQSTVCWWRRTPFWWKSRKTWDLFSCSCKDHIKDIPILPLPRPCLPWPVGLEVCRCEEAKCEQQRESQAGRRHVLLLMICSDWDWLLPVHARETSWSSRFRYSSPSAGSPHLTSRIMSASLTDCSDEKWPGSVRWIILLLRSQSLVFLYSF